VTTATGFPEISAEASRLALHEAVEGLWERDPDASARVAFVRWQKVVAGVLLLVVIAGLVFATRFSIQALCLACTFTYLVTMIDRTVIFRRGLDGKAIVRISDEEALALTDDELPHYTVLVPAYNEPEVVGRLLAAMSALVYPPEKLEVQLLLEADDEVTIEAARREANDPRIRTILVPPADPRTKPKACNYGLEFAVGEIVTIYDAEDKPEPLQLRRVVAAFRKLSSDVACVQAKLSFHNSRQNLLTAWFTAEYGLWFGYLLPGLMDSRSPIPLGGTSNHLRRDVLDQVGAWDPFNVTEDADLGMRIASGGYRTAVLDSVTIEEANSDMINWVRQRSRWYKGYLQTYLVHMRHPLRLFKQLGFRSFARFNLLMAGTPIVALLNMFFWFITLLWILGQPSEISLAFPAVTYYAALLCIVAGNAATLYMNVVGARATGDSHLLWACLTVPLYWVMMGIASTKGCWQLITKPSYWEKTFHGLDAVEDETGSDSDSAPA
jgi:cellulose synthase/poly-beta-1,6-N-acetylglucosamine synthase-like glycosyltransferase